MNIKEAKPSHYSRIMEIWESSVKATHDFLKNEDFEYFKALIPTEFLPQLRVFIIEDQNHIPAFFAVSDDNLEMLFVDDSARGKGYGKQSILYAIHQLNILKVDVNEQNGQAVDFYFKMGYVQTARSEKDGMGKDYPLLHLEYTK